VCGEPDVEEAAGCHQERASIRQHICQHASAYVSICCHQEPVSIRQHTCQQTCQHTSAHVSIRRSAARRARAPDARALSICTFVLIKHVITFTFVLVRWRKSARRAGSQYVYFCTSTASQYLYFCTSKKVKPVAKSREPSRDSARRAGSRHLKSRCWSLVSKLIWSIGV
jgi:hypothetical protein